MSKSSIRSIPSILGYLGWIGMAAKDRPHFWRRSICLFHYFLSQPDAYLNAVDKAGLLMIPAKGTDGIDDFAIPDEPESYNSSLSDIEKLNRAYNEGRPLTEEEAAIEDRLATMAEYGPEMQMEEEYYEEPAKVSFAVGTKNGCECSI